MSILSDREKKRKREKQEAILAMAGTIAHELNSPLQIVLGNSQFLQDDFEKDIFPRQVRAERICRRRNNC